MAVGREQVWMSIALQMISTSWPHITPACVVGFTDAYEYDNPACPYSG